MSDFSKEQLEKALTLPRMTKRRLQPEDRARNQKHLELAEQHGMRTQTKAKAMSEFDDEGQLKSMDDVDWYGIVGHDELGLYQHEDEAALAYCRHHELGEYERVDHGSTPQGTDAATTDEARNAGVVDQNIVEGSIAPITADKVNLPSEDNTSN